MSRNRATEGVAGAIPVAPLVLWSIACVDHGLTPVATSYRPVGTESPLRLSPARGDDCDSAAARGDDCDLAAARRQDVAMGREPMEIRNPRYKAPNGATGIRA